MATPSDRPCDEPGQHRRRTREDPCCGGCEGMIILEHVSRWYGQVIGINDVSCQILPGITALLGPNGAGKSTLIKLLTGQLHPSTGRLTVLGEAPFANSRVYRRLGYCPELERGCDDMTGRYFVTLLAHMGGLPPAT